jgi:hypothetical protein
LAVKYLAGERLIGTAAERVALDVVTIGDTTTVSSMTDVVFDATTQIGTLTYSGNEITLSGDTYARHGINGNFQYQNSGTQVLQCVAQKTGTSAWIRLGLSAAKLVEVGVTGNAEHQMEYAIRSADDGRTWYKTGSSTWTQASNTSDNVTFKISNNRSTVTYYADGSSIGSTTHGTPAAAYYPATLVAQTGTAGSYVFDYTGDVRISTTAYPNLTNGTIFEESDTGKHQMFDGTDTWNEIT